MELRRHASCYHDLRCGACDQQADCVLERRTARFVGAESFVDFGDDLRHRRGLHPKTVSKKLTLIGAILQLAVDTERLSVKAASRLRVVVERTPKPARQPFEIDALNLVFGSVLYTGTRHIRGSGGEAGFWLPVIALYTGMRLEEIAQLEVTDVKKNTAIDYISVNDARANKHIKTDESRRRILIHPQLREFGFLVYVDRCRAAGTNRLLHQLRPNCKNKACGNWSRWFGRYLRRVVKIHDKRLVLHSLRHMFRRACREAGVAE